MQKAVQINDEFLLFERMMTVVLGDELAPFFVLVTGCTHKMHH